MSTFSLGRARGSFCVAKLTGAAVPKVCLPTFEVLFCWAGAELQGKPINCFPSPHELETLTSVHWLVGGEILGLRSFQLVVADWAARGLRGVKTLGRR